MWVWVHVSVSAQVGLCICVRVCVWWWAVLTVVRHAHWEALLEAAVLALVAVLLLNLAAAFALVVLQLQANGPPEKPLCQKNRSLSPWMWSTSGGDISGLFLTKVYKVVVWNCLVLDVYFMLKTDLQSQSFYWLCSPALQRVTWLWECLTTVLAPHAMEHNKYFFSKTFTTVDINILAFAKRSLC